MGSPDRLVDSDDHWAECLRDPRELIEHGSRLEHGHAAEPEVHRRRPGFAPLQESGGGDVLGDGNAAPTRSLALMSMPA